MCCGQKRAQLTGTTQIPSPRTFPRFTRSSPANYGAPAKSTPAAVVKAPDSAHSSAGTTATSLHDSNGPAGDGFSVQIQYKERSPIQVRGLVTGRVYQFSCSQPVQAVDQRDSPALLQTSLFRRV